MSLLGLFYVWKGVYLNHKQRKQRGTDMKLTYWISDCETDSSCYSIRKSTKKAVQLELDAYPEKGYPPSGMSKPRKVTVNYKNALELVELCLSGDDHGGFELRR